MNIRDINSIMNNHINFKNEDINYLNTLAHYDRKEIKKEIEDIYHKEKYNFI